MNIPLTLYTSYRNTTKFETRSFDWDGLVSLFADHTRLQVKNEGPGFGPYVLEAPPFPCSKHQKSGPHRCNSCVQELTAAVYDADAGTPEQVVACSDKLTAENVTHFWY